MKQEQNRIINKQEPLYTYSIPVPIDTVAAFDKATAYVKAMTEQQKKHIYR